MTDIIMHGAFGIFIGLCLVFMVDGYFAIKERRERLYEETDKYLRK